MVTKEKFKTYGNVFDAFTLRNLFKLETQGHFKELIGPVSIGKEANIFEAITDDDTKVIIKIYRLETCDFNRMFDYIKVDPRYASLKKKKREIIFSWAQREYRNLLIARELGIRVPTPHTCLHNILVLDYIGEKKTAPKMKDLLADDVEEYAQEVFALLRRMVKGGLVHGDLSEFNILTYQGKPVFIDFSQATPTTAHNARELLERDCKNLCKFFNKHGVKITPQELYEKVTKP